MDEFVERLPDSCIAPLLRIVSLRKPTARCQQVQCMKNMLVTTYAIPKACIAAGKLILQLTAQYLKP